MENRFNLLDEPWIPVAGVGRVSLNQIFSVPDYRALGGSPVEKIALMKLLLAIAQAACTPADEAEWRALGAQGLAEKCLGYLEKWRDCFYLYGDKPFLQIPAIITGSLKSYGTIQPEKSTGNTTLLNQMQVERSLQDSEKAVLLICQMGFALGGKQVDNSVVLTPGYQGKTKAGKPGPAVAHQGLLHSFLLGENLWFSLWLNLLTQTQIAATEFYPQGVGQPPWEKMPVGENCAVAQELQLSLMGRLLPLCRFCLLTEDGLHYSEGIAHQGYKEGKCDPTVAINWSGKDPKALWCNPEKRPWRELTSLLSFINQQQGAGFECLQLKVGIERTFSTAHEFYIWSGGLKVRRTSGEQQVKQSDDFVESLVLLHAAALNELWFDQLKLEMSALDELAKNLYGRVVGYFKEQLVDGANLAAQATNMFWQLCERDFQQLIDSCDQGEVNRDVRLQLRRRFAAYLSQAYDQFCPNDTARQLDAWARCRPNLSKYLAQEA